MGICLVLSLMTLVVGGQVRSRDAPIANVKNGTYQGVRNHEYNQDFFLGMAYAQPPVGTLRCRQARALNTTWADRREATAYSSLCVGYGVSSPFRTECYC
jgi:carboxylesterase type B